eukprot:XP_011669739.1 PREDICTED: leucine-rich repeat and coiled-coil domain-containing protein 1 [Strongylocentrotus purpuratus]
MHGRGNFRVKFSGVASPSEQHIDDDLAGTGAPDEFCLMDAGVQNLKDLPLTAHIQSINLHCNQIAKIENLQNLRHLRHLDLSSNHLTRIEGLDGLLNLRTLNVACNQLSTITGLRSLKSLLKLNASYNQIHDISGLRELHGSDYSLTHLHLHGNQLSSAEHLIGCLAGLSRLCHVTFLHEQSHNPVCRLPGYRTALFNSLPQLISLDGADRTGISIQTNDGLSDIPGLEQYLEYLLSSDVGSGAEQEKETPLQIITPKIDQVLEKFRQRALASSGTSTTEKEDENYVRITALKQSQVGQAFPAAHTRSTSHEDRLKILEQQLMDIMTRRPQVPEASPSTDSHEEPGRQGRKRVSSGRIHVARKDTDPTDDSDSEMGRRGRKHGGKKPATGRQRNKSEERVSKTSKIKSGIAVVYYPVIILFSSTGYRTALFNSLPQLISLDGADRTGITIQTNDGLSDIPGLEQYLEYLLSSDVGSGAEQEKETPLQIITPKIDQVLEKFRQRALASSGASTTEKEDENNVRITALKESHIGQAYPAAHTRSTSHEERLKILEQQLVDIMTRRPQVPEASPSTDSHEEPGRHARKRVSSGRIHVARKDTDPTDDSDSEMGRRGRKHGGKKPATGRQRNKSEERVSKTSKIPTRTKTKSCPSPGSSQGVSTSPSSGLERTVEPSAASRRVVPTTPEQDADKLSLLQELDRERERRWKAEQAAIRLADHIQDVQTKANEERELQEVVVEASGRLKQAVMNEKEMKSRLEDDISILKGRLKETMHKLSVTQRAEEEQRQTLRAMEETARRMESEKLKQQAHDAKRLQEYQLRAAAGQRELELVRVKSGQQEGKVHQLQELLATREQEHRIETLTKQYTDLEDEFRLALQIESNRFQEVSDVEDEMRQLLAETANQKRVTEEKIRRLTQAFSEIQDLR